MINFLICSPSINAVTKYLLPVPTEDYFVICNILKGLRCYMVQSCRVSRKVRPTAKHCLNFRGGIFSSLRDAELEFIS